MMRITDTVKHLIIINVILWIGTWLLLKRGIDLTGLLALYFPENPNFKIWQIVSHMFMHSQSFYFHIIFNMLALWMFGTPLEQMWGRNKFLFFYFSAGLGAALLQLAVYYFNFYQLQDLLVSQGFSLEEIRQLLSLPTQDLIDQLNSHTFNGKPITNIQEIFDRSGDSFRSAMLGASGAISGILVAFAFMFPNAELMLIFLPIPIKAKYFVPGIFALDLFSGVTGISVLSPGNTAHFAHLGGALAGFIMMWYWKKNQFRNNRWD